MKQTRKRVSLVIPAYNEEHQLTACLDAVAAQTEAPFEVIVVDNNSTDKTAELARSYPFVRVITERQQGRVFARNAGFNATRGDVIGRIDADIVLPPDWIAHVASFYQDARHVNWAWTGSGYFSDVRFPRLVACMYGLLAFRLNWLVLGHYTLWGSNMALTRQQWQAVQKQVCLRNDIHEDLDIAIHVRRAGFAIAYDTSIKTNAELRPLHANRHERWEYLQWWPRTLRVHGKHAWPLVWLFGAFALYYVSFLWNWAERLARLVGRPPRPRDVSKDRAL